MFVDAVVFCEQYPKVKRVNNIQLSLIKEGNEVQLKSQGENFWVTVMSVNIQAGECNNSFTGKVIEEPTFDQPFRREDIVYFETRHIFNIRIEYQLF
jgi:hypothetical protein